MKTKATENLDGYHMKKKKIELESVSIQKYDSSLTSSSLNQESITSIQTQFDTKESNVKETERHSIEISEHGRSEILVSEKRDMEEINEDDKKRIDSVKEEKSNHLTLASEKECQKDTSSSKLNSNPNLNRNLIPNLNPNSNSKSKTKKTKKEKGDYIYGNYPFYYGYRVGSSIMNDARLKYFKKEWFENKNCLDIGCNEGHVTIAIAQKFCVKKILGVDIDPLLIGKARKFLIKHAKNLKSEFSYPPPINATSSSSTSASTHLSFAPRSLLRRKLVMQARSDMAMVQKERNEHMMMEKNKEEKEKEERDQSKIEKDEKDEKMCLNDVEAQEEEKEEGRDEKKNANADEGKDDDEKEKKDVNNSEKDNDKDNGKDNGKEKKDEKTNEKDIEKDDEKNDDKENEKDDVKEEGLSSEELMARVFFKRENFLEGIVDHQTYYDTVVCLSVTKWIHLNWGDAGLMKFFAKVYNSLHLGGVFVLEPQPWSSYKKKRLISDVSKKHFQECKIRPNDFPEILLEKIGFKSFETITPGVKESKNGFERPIFVYFK